MNDPARCGTDSGYQRHQRRGEMNGPCFRCFVGQHDRCEGVAHPLGLPAAPCVCDGCGLLNAAPAAALHIPPVSAPLKPAGAARPK